MEIKILKDEKDHIEVELVGETHTIANAVKDECYNDSNVVSATYSIEHPFKPNPKLTVRTKSGTAKKALKEAAERLEKTASDFESKLKKAL